MRLMSLQAAWIALAALLAVPCATPSVAHEFWIEPHAFRIAPEAPVVADIRVGDKLSGSAFSYVPPNFKRFDMVIGDTVVPVEGRAGDRPALNMVAGADGLASIVHVTKDYALTYTNWAKFERFCAHKDFTWAPARHEARGLPRDRVRERYTRYGKSLVALGRGAGQDRDTGMTTEIIALANPYTDDLSDGLPVRVMLDGAPRVDAQVEVFERAPDGTLDIRLTRTDADGRAVVQVRPGHFYLIDAVVMRELPAQTPDDLAWHSLWASLTFEVPQ